MKHLFIINPAAGGKKNRYRETVDHIHAVMAGHSGQYEVYITKAPMDACLKIRKDATSGEPLRVYACGGDGTLNECVNGAAGNPHVAVTHYPCGTGNDFVKLFGKEDEALFRSLPALIDGTTRPIDLIEVVTPDESRFGINICSVGIDARIGADVHKYSGIPIIGGATGYVVSMFVNIVRGVNQRLAVTVNGAKYDDNFALVCACNGRFYGGGFNPIPDAIPDDGIIDFLIISAVTRLKLISVIGKYAKGRFREIPDLITYMQGTDMRINTQSPLVVNVDGEILRAQDVTFKMMALGVTFIFPAGMHFFN